MIILKKTISIPYQNYQLIKTWVMICPECKSNNISSNYNPDSPSNSFICVACNHLFLFDSSKLNV